MVRRTLLSRNFLFRALSPERQRTLEKKVHRRTFAAGEVVFEQGDSGDAMYLIRSGQVSVEVDGVELTRLDAGYHFGEIALVDGYPRSATVRATEEARLVYLHRDDFVDAMRADPVMAAVVYRNFAYYLATQLRRTSTQAARYKALQEEGGEQR